MLGGAGGIRHFVEDRWIKFVVGIKRASNNVDELKSLHLIPHLSHAHGILKIHIFGDSTLMIVCFKLRRLPKNLLLGPIYEDILRYIGLFTDLTFY